MQKNILIVIDQLYKGGAQKVAARLSIELSERYRVVIATYNRSDAMYRYGGEHIFIDLPFSKNPSTNHFIARIIRFVLLIVNLRKIKRRNKIDVAISFLEASNIVNVFSRRKEKLILSVRAHLSREFSDDKRLHIFKTLIRKLYNRAFKVVTPSEEIKVDLVKNFSVREEKITVIYNFINKTDFLKQSSEPVDEPQVIEAFAQGPVLINVGRLTNPKGQWFLPRILKKVQEKVPGTRLIILGAGPLKERIEREALHSKLTTFDGTENKHPFYDIYLPGFKDNPFPYLRKSDIFVFPSVYEGFPNVMLEAMSCGLPIISSDCFSGPREILAPGTTSKQQFEEIERAEYGMLLPVMNDQDTDLNTKIELWAEAIIEMLVDEKIRGNYLQKSDMRSADFGKEQIIGDWLKLIDN
jgi:glycosyltransferase involved in cell wall biosynthesis